MNSFEELLLERQSCRNYNGEPVSAEKLKKLLELAHLAPSACNSQPWKTIVVSGQEAEKVRKAVQRNGRNTFTNNCPTFSIIIEKKAKLAPGIDGKIDSQTYAQMDIGIFTAHYILAASELGLSTCVLGWIDKEMLKNEFNINDDETIRLVIATGYASEADHIRKKSRKDINDFVEFIG